MLIQLDDIFFHFDTSLLHTLLWSELDTIAMCFEGKNKILVVFNQVCNRVKKNGVLSFYFSEQGYLEISEVSMG